MLSEHYGWTPNQIGELTLRQISVYLMPLKASANEAVALARRQECAREQFINEHWE